MKKTDVSKAIEYLEQIQKNPAEKEKFNRSIKQIAEREKKRKNGEFSGMFLSAIRLP